MSAEPILGAPLAAVLRRQCEDALRARGVVPVLVNVVVGDAEASQSYLGAIDRAAKARGIESRRLVLPRDIDEDALCAAVRRAGDDPSVHGLMLQFPLPDGISRDRVTACVPPHKDVDGLHDESLGGVLAGRRTHTAPATAAAVAEILASDERLSPRGRHVVVVGRSLVVGRPLAAMLGSPGRDADATVTVCHRRTADLSRHTRAADIVIVAAGQRHMLTRDMIRPGAVVIDVGTHAVSDDAGRFTLTGDVHPDVAEVAGFLTPVPGGVGPVTTAVLMRHVTALALPGALPPAW